MDLFKGLPRTNCGDCRVPTCLAFAAAVFRGEKRIEDCPHLDGGLIERFNGERPYRTTMEQEFDQALEPVRRELAKVDFSTAAERLRASHSEKGLTIKCLGKDFTVDPQGTVTSACHIHSWVMMPLINYVIHCEGKPLSGNWVPFRELKHGAERSPLFVRRCEGTLKQVADRHTDLFEDMIDIFNAEPAPNAFDSDIAVVLYPLPRIPMLICYWRPDEGMESQLNIFYDDSADHNLPIQALYTLSTGLVIMLDKIAYTHAESWFRP
jgi:hypothetical protein